jgi:phosphoglycolate phosphatase
MKKLLITDLIILYMTGVSFYAQSFTAMLDELVVILGVPANVLIDEFSRSI